MMQQPMHQAGVVIARSRMHHQLSRFVDDDDIVILIKNLKIHLMRDNLGRAHWWKIDDDAIVCLNGISRLDHLPVHRDKAFFDEFLRLGARGTQPLTGQIMINAISGNSNNMIDYVRHENCLTYARTHVNTYARKIILPSTPDTSSRSL